MKIFTSPRLEIYSFVQNDLEDLYKLHSDPEVAKSTIDGVQDLKTVQEHLNSFIAHQDKYGFSQWAIRLKDTKEFIGRSGLTIRELDSDLGEKPEIRFALLPKFWGQGYASEITDAIVKYAFNILHLKQVAAAHGRLNQKSERILIKAGFQFMKFILPGEYALKEPIKYYIKNADKL